MTLSVGQIVHYVSYGTPGGEHRSRCVAAIITEIPNPMHPADLRDAVGLCVLNPSGIFFRDLANGGCEYHEGDIGQDHAGNEISAISYPGGTWHWPGKGEA